MKQLLSQKCLNLLRLLLLAGLVLGGLAAHAERPIIPLTDVNPATLRDTNTLDAVNWSKGLDFQKYPEVLELQNKIVELLKKLEIEDDSKNPLILIIEDDMSLNASFQKSASGPDILRIHLGLLASVDSDDELAFVLGHELEHGNSVINDKMRLNSAFNRFHYGHDSTEQRINSLMQRVAENEVDLKSVINRLLNKGFNPSAARTALMKILGLDVGLINPTHTRTSTRLDAIDALLLGLKRKVGQRFASNDLQTEIVSQQLKDWLESEKFHAQREQMIENLILETESKISELLELISKEPGALKSENEDLQTQVLELSGEILKKSESSRWMVNKAFDNILSDNEQLVWQLRVQQRVMEAVNPIREAIKEHHLGPHLQNHPELLELALFQGKNHLGESNWQNHITRAYEKYYKLVKKQEKIKERLKTGDFSTWSSHDDTSDVVTAQLQLQRLPERIEKAFAEYLEEVELWYQWPGEIEDFHAIVHEIVEKLDETGAGSPVPGVVKTHFEKLRYMEAHLGPARENIAEFAATAGIEIQKVLIPEPQMMFQPYQKMIDALRKASAPEKAHEIIRKYIRQLTQQMVVFSDMETEELVANVKTHSSSYEAEEAINYQFVSFVEAISKFVTEEESGTTLSKDDPVVQKAYNVIEEQLLAFQEKHGLSLKIDLSWKKEDFTLGHNGKKDAISVSKTRANSVGVGTYVSRQGDLFRKKYENPGEFLKISFFSSTKHEYQFSVREIQGRIKMELKEIADAFKRYYSTGAQHFPVDLTKALEMAHLDKSETVTPEDPEQWQLLKHRLFQGALSFHLFDFYRLDPQGSLEIYADFLRYYRDLKETGDKDTLELFASQLGITGFLFFAARMDLPHAEVLHILNNHNELFKYESQYEIHEKISVVQLKNIADYMRGFKYPLLNTEIHALTINAAFSTFLSAKGVASSDLEAFFEGFVASQKEDREYDLYQPFRRTALKKIRKLPTPETFAEIFDEIQNRLNLSQRSEYADAMPKNQLNINEKALMTIGFAQFIKNKSAEGQLSYSEKSDVGFFIRDHFNVKVYEDMDVLSPEVKAQFIHMMMTSMNPDALRDTMFHSYMADIQKSGGDMEYFMNPEWIPGFFYDSYRVDLAYWQLNNKFNLDDLARKLRSGESPLPGKTQVRQLIKDILLFVDQQFPSHSLAKEEVLNKVEDALLTSQAETRFVLDYRANSDNWADHGKVATFDFPENLQRNMKSAEDKFQLIEYLLNLRTKIPGFVDRMYEDTYNEAKRFNRGRRSDADLRKEADRKLKQGKVAVESVKALFRNQSSATQAVVLSQLLGMSEDEVLGDPVYKEKVTALILGSHSDSLIVKEIFEGYLESAPTEQYKHLISYILAAKHTKDGSDKQSLKPIFEAMGAFGIKAAQFLYSSGLLSAEMAEDLKDFLSAASPPPRYEVVHFLEKAFGRELTGITHIGDLLGSGSINFVSEVLFERNGQALRRVVRIRRPFLEGLNENENEIWEKVVHRLQKKVAEGGNLTPEELQQMNDAASIINEARRQAYATLKEGGRELDLKFERDMEDLVSSYNRSASEPALKGWRLEPIKHDQELQKLIPEEMQSLISIYEKIDHTDLEKLGSPELKKAIAVEILRTELKALFHHGRFDPDGHLGNWMIDVAGKRIVRIDYAQALVLTDEVRIAFQNVFFELIRSKPEFLSGKMASYLSQLIEAPEGVTILPQHLEGLDIRFDADATNFHQRLFELRKAINSHLKSQGVLTAHQEIQFSETMRAAFSSLSKMRKLQEEMGTAAFFNEFNQYNTNVTGDSLKLKAWNAWNTVSNWLDFSSSETTDDTDSSKTQLNTSPLPEAEVTETLNPEDFDRDILKDDIIPQGQGMSHSANRLGVTDVQEDHVKMDLSRSLERRPKDEVILISKKQFEALPIGTELHAYHRDANGTRGKFVIGMSRTGDQELRDYNGTVNYGVLKSDYEKFGGPARTKVLSAGDYLTDFTANIVTEDKARTPLVLLTQAQLDQLPDGVMLVNVNMGRFLKGQKGTAEFINAFDDNPMFLNVGIPSNAVKGYEDVGVDFSRFSHKPLPACANLLQGERFPVPSPATPPADGE